MLRCAVSRGSSCAKLLTAAHRAKSTWAPSIIDEIDREYGLIDPVFGQRPFEDAKTEKSDGLSTTEEAGQATSRPEEEPKPLKRRELPLSPYMDPELLSARKKYRQPKQPPSKTPTDFQKQLARNPYALALATPIRACRVTLHHLPRYFLQDFNVVEHPETREPWWLPRSLAQEYSPRSLRKGEEYATWESEEADDNEEVDIEDSYKAGVQDGADEPEMDNSKSGTEYTTKEPVPLPQRVGPRAYVLARQDLLAGLSGPRNHKSSHILASVFPVRTRAKQALQALYSSAKIRPDIDTFTLELMRRRTVEELEYLVKSGSYIRPCETWEDAMKAKRQPGAILWTGGVKSEIEVGEAPPEFATVQIGTAEIKTAKIRKVPVHNLQTLLGEEHLQRLRDVSKVFRNELLIIKHRNRTVGVEMKLWRLQGYLAEYPEFREAFASRAKEAIEHEVE
jgi:hypothetical protein